MLKNYLKIALRNLQRSPAYAFINVFGPALGIMCCLLIGLYVQDELSFDRFHEKGDRIFRIAISPLLLLGVVVFALGVAFATVGFQAIRAARIDPAQSLRYE
ncbi:MAG TPA: hypothetical protein VKP65_21800 [Rhodothermales bacterium]|nr:hypothetical protein [Rhodothermales bacterium]